MSLRYVKSCNRDTWAVKNTSGSIILLQLSDRVPPVRPAPDKLLHFRCKFTLTFLSLIRYTFSWIDWFVENKIFEGSCQEKKRLQMIKVFCCIKHQTDFLHRRCLFNQISLFDKQKDNPGLKCEVISFYCRDMSNSLSLVCCRRSLGNFKCSWQGFCSQHDLVTRTA